MLVIVRCAGGESTWDNYLGTPRHLVKLCGERLLDRTVRLVLERRPDADIRVIVPNGRDSRYRVEGSTRVGDKPNPANGDIDKFLSTAHLWPADSDVVHLFGDVWYSDDAMDSILTTPPPRDFATWLRFGPDGHGGEIFAFRWPASSNPWVLDECTRIAGLYAAGILEGLGHNGKQPRGEWALYRGLAGAGLGDHADHGYCTIVDDWTEDMDAPSDWDEWCYRWATADPETRPPKHTG